MSTGVSPTDMEATKSAEDLLPLLRRFATGDYGIALGGAHAKGVHDTYSDLDLYLFAERWLPGPARDQLCRVILGMDTPVRSWGQDGCAYDQAGTDFMHEGRRVECWLRGVDYVSRIVDAVLAGVVHRDFVTWTAMGYFNHCTLSDLQHMVILNDPRGILAGWQGRVAEYTYALRHAIIEAHLSAAQFWPDNSHYESAVARGDVLYCMAIAQQAVQNLIQVTFALNEVYFPGEKKLGRTLERLPHKPDDFVRRVESVVCPCGEAGPALLADQRTALQALVREVTALVDASHSQ